MKYEETKYLIDRVLSFDQNHAPEQLELELAKMNRSIQALYDGLLLHAQFMSFYTSDQWLDFHRKVPHLRLRRDAALMNKLSPKHRQLLEGS